MPIFVNRKISFIGLVSCLNNFWLLRWVQMVTLCLHCLYVQGKNIAMHMMPNDCMHRSCQLVKWYKIKLLVEDNARNTIIADVTLRSANCEVHWHHKDKDTKRKAVFMVSVQTIKTCVVIKKKMGDMPHALPRTCFPSTTPNCSQGFLRKQHILCWRTFSEVTWLNSIWSYCNLQVWTLLGKVTRTCCYFLFFLCACVCVWVVPQDTAVMMMG